MNNNRWINFITFISPIIQTDEVFINYNILRISSQIWQRMTPIEQNAFNINSNVSQQVVLLQLQQRNLFNYDVLFNEENLIPIKQPLLRQIIECCCCHRNTNL